MTLASESRGPDQSPDFKLPNSQREASEACRQDTNEDQPLEPIAYLDNYALLSLIDENEETLVYLASDNDTNQLVTLRYVKPTADTQCKRYANLVRRWATLAHMDDPSIVQIHYFKISENSTYAVHPHLEAETLASFSQSQEPVKPSMAAEALLYLIRAIRYSSCLGVLPRHLNPETIAIRTEPSRIRASKVIRPVILEAAFSIDSDSPLPEAPRIRTQGMYAESHIERRLDRRTSDTLAFRAIAAFLLVMTGTVRARCVPWSHCIVWRSLSFVTQFRRRTRVPPVLERILVQCLHFKESDQTTTLRSLEHDVEVALRVLRLAERLGAVRRPALLTVLWRTLTILLSYTAQITAVSAVLCISLAMTFPALLIPEGQTVTIVIDRDRIQAQAARIDQNEGFQQVRDNHWDTMFTSQVPASGKIYAIKNTAQTGWLPWRRENFHSWLIQDNATRPGQHTIYGDPIRQGLIARVSDRVLTGFRVPSFEQLTRDALEQDLARGKECFKNNRLYSWKPRNQQSSQDICIVNGVTYCPLAKHVFCRTDHGHIYFYCDMLGRLHLIKTSDGPVSQSAGQRRFCNLSRDENGRFISVVGDDMGVDVLHENAYHNKSTQGFGTPTKEQGSAKILVPVRRLLGVGSDSRFVKLSPRGLSHVAPITGLEFHHGMRDVWSAAHDGSIFLWDTDLRTRHELSVDRVLTRNAVRLDPGRFLVMDIDDNIFQVSSSGSRMRFQSISETQKVLCVERVSSDGLIAIGYDSGKIRFFAADSDRAVREVEVCKRAVRCISASQDGRVVVVASDEGMVYLVSGSQRRVELLLKPIAEEVCDVAVSLDGLWVAASYESGKIIIVNLEVQREIVEVFGHDGPVYTLCFTPDSSRIASGGEDGTVRLWDPSSGREVLRFEVSYSRDSRGDAFVGRQFGIRVVRFSSDGVSLVCGGADGCIRIWTAEAM